MGLFAKLETRNRILARSLGDCQDLGDSRLCFRVFKGTITYWLNLETRNSISELKNTFPGHRPYGSGGIHLLSGRSVLAAVIANLLGWFAVYFFALVYVITGRDYDPSLMQRIFHYCMITMLWGLDANVQYIRQAAK